MLNLQSGHDSNPNQRDSLPIPFLELGHQHEFEIIQPDEGLRSEWEPLMPGSSLKLLMALDYAQAANTCAKMLAVRSPERIEAVLKAIAESGMNPWSVALVAGPKTLEKLACLGVTHGKVKCLKKALLLSPYSNRGNHYPAIRHLASFPGVPEVVEALLALQGHADFLTRLEVAQALASFNASPEAAIALAVLAMDSDDHVRWTTAKSLASFSTNPDALNALIALSGDSVPFVRGTTALALASFPESPESLATLLRLSCDEASTVRTDAAHALAWFPDSSGALGALAVLSTDSDCIVRRAAHQALRDPEKDPASSYRIQGRQIPW